MSVNIKQKSNHVNSGGGAGRFSREVPGTRNTENTKGHEKPLPMPLECYFRFAVCKRFQELKTQNAQKSLKAAFREGVPGTPLGLGPRVPSPLPLSFEKYPQEELRSAGGASLRSFVPATELTTRVNSVAGTNLRPQGGTANRFQHPWLFPLSGVGKVLGTAILD
jgi:hypothetical protein